jgi:exonuclease VII small subunit
MGNAPLVVSVQRLSARAVLDDSPAVLAHAKELAAAGDESWEQWVAEYQRGEALIVRLELTLELADGTAEVVTTSRDGFFVENHAHAPKVEQQIAELASGDLSSLAAEMAERGHALDAYDLGTMYVHVELDPELRRRLQDGGAAA